MKHVEHPDHWGRKYYVARNGLHEKAFSSLEEAEVFLSWIISLPDTESVVLETRDFWLEKIDD